MYMYLQRDIMTVSLMYARQLYFWWNTDYQSLLDDIIDRLEKQHIIPFLSSFNNKVVNHSLFSLTDLLKNCVNWHLNASVSFDLGYLFLL